MEILGVGMSELVFIVIIALIVLGPKDMQKAGKTIGKWMRSIVTSDGWKIFQQTSRELRTLPNKLMREANEELNQIGNQLGKEVTGASTPTGSRLQTPGTPPLSKPFTPPSPPIKPAAKEITNPAPENASPDGQHPETENESDQQSNG